MRAVVIVSLIAGAASAAEPIEDDPRGRARAAAVVYGLRTAEAQWAIMQEAAAEAAKYGMTGRHTAATIHDTNSKAWVNLDLVWAVVIVATGVFTLFT